MFPWRESDLSIVFTGPFLEEELDAQEYVKICELKLYLPQHILMVSRKIGFPGFQKFQFQLQPAVGTQRSVDRGIGPSGISQKVYSLSPTVSFT